MQPMSRTSSPASTDASAAFAPAPPTRIVILSVSTAPPGGGRSVTGLISTSACTQPITVIVVVSGWEGCAAGWACCDLMSLFQRETRAYAKYLSFRRYKAYSYASTRHPIRKGFYL